MMKRHAPARWQHVLKLALPGCMGFSLLASLLMSLTASCMACPTCTLALARRSETTDNTPLVLLALLAGNATPISTTPVSAAPANGTTNKRIWVTAYDYTGNLQSSTNAYINLVLVSTVAPTGATGIDGADNKCNWAADPNWPGRGTYKALIADASNRVACTNANCSSGPGEHISWVLQPNTTYYQADGVTEIFTSDANGVWNFATAGEWPNRIWPGSLNPQVWTGLKEDWTTQSVTCSNWTNGVYTSYGAQGVSTGYDGTSAFASKNNIYAYNKSCSNSAAGEGIGRIYCVEQ